MYLPKFKQRRAEYTEGSEFATKQTGEEYVGYYVPTTDGRYFTGDRVSNRSKELLKMNKIQANPETVVKERYDNLHNDDRIFDLRTTTLLPEHRTQPQPNTKVVRFFAQEKKTGRIYEISQESYLAVSSRTSEYHWPSYVVVKILWDYTIPVADQQESSYIRRGSNTRNKEAAKKITLIPGLYDYLIEIKELI